jgi:hypothetical protein
LDKVKQYGCQPVYNWINKQSDYSTRRHQKEQIKILFGKFIENEPSMVQRANEQLMKEKELEDEEEKDDFFNVEKVREKQPTRPSKKKQNFIVEDWQNAVLILVSTRLGLKKVQREYFSAVRYFFTQSFNVGIVGGRPKEAFYFVGLQGEFLIFLDPHVTKDAILPDVKTIKLNHLQCHEETAKKLHFTKLEPTMTFCFYLRSHEDYRKFENFMEEGK